jgi:hypothetical protein
MRTTVIDIFKFSRSIPNFILNRRYLCCRFNHSNALLEVKIEKVSNLTGDRNLAKMQEFIAANNRTVRTRTASGCVDAECVCAGPRSAKCVPKFKNMYADIRVSVIDYYYKHVFIS